MGRGPSVRLSISFLRFVRSRPMVWTIKLSWTSCVRQKPYILLELPSSFPLSFLIRYLLSPLRDRIIDVDQPNKTTRAKDRVFQDIVTLG